MLLALKGRAKLCCSGADAIFAAIGTKAGSSLLHPASVKMTGERGLAQVKAVP